MIYNFIIQDFTTYPNLNFIQLVMPKINLSFNLLIKFKL